MTWGKSLAFLKLMDNSDALVQIGVHHIWLSSDNVSICCDQEGVDTFPLHNAVPKQFQEEFYVSPTKGVPAGAGLSGGFPAQTASPYGMLLRRASVL